jgi:hypothetical protein
LFVTSLEPISGYSYLASALAVLFQGDPSYRYSGSFKFDETLEDIVADGVVACLDLKVKVCPRFRVLTNFDSTIDAFIGGKDV